MVDRQAWLRIDNADLAHHAGGEAKTWKLKRLKPQKWELEEGKKKCLLRMSTERSEFSSFIILQVQKEDHTKITKR